jgi:hypothetical protein
MSLPILFHEEFGVNCCGCLVETIDPERRFHCAECGAAVPVEDVQRVLLDMKFTEATCPVCGKVNCIGGFSKVDAFVCEYCGAGVGVVEGG